MPPPRDPDDTNEPLVAPAVRPALAVTPLQGRPQSAQRTEGQFRRPTASELGLAENTGPGQPPPRRIDKTDVFGQRPTASQLGLDRPDHHAHDAVAPRRIDKTEPFGVRPTHAQLGIDDSGARTTQNDSSDPFLTRSASPAPARRADTMTVTKLSTVTPPPAPSLPAALLPPPALRPPPRATGPLDPPMAPASSSGRPRPTEALDPPMPPARRPTESLDPPLPPARRPTESLDPPMPPARRTTAPPTRATSRDVDESAMAGKASGDASGAKPRPATPLRHLLRDHGSLVGVVAVVCGLVVASIGGGDGLDPGRYSADEQVALSALWRSTVGTTGRQLRNDGVSGAVGNVFGTVSRALAVPGQAPTRLLVLSDAGVRAFALPDGTVVVSVGLLRRLDSEAQLAAVLAHALAHHALGDISRALPEFDHGLSLALSASPPTDALAAAAIGDTMVHDDVSEAAADALAIRALKIAAWDALAMRQAIEALKGTPWLAQHGGGPQRADALSIEERRRLPGSNLLQNDSGKSNTPEYQTRVLDGLGAGPRPTAPASSTTPPAPLPPSPPSSR